ncbi:MAG: Rrf2 family transcriptional regulator [Chlorobi bacterium]|nr:Rrf2 family transcriptional regulator [Chlorobiota bacterium]
MRYGLRAMIEIAKNNDGKAVLQKDISRAQEISAGYLDTIIASLKSAGLIKNYAGKHSGYVLAKSAVDINVYDIYKAFEPDINIVNCTCPSNECSRLNICPATDYWSSLNDVIRENMIDTSLRSFLIGGRNGKVKLNKIKIHNLNKML